MEITFAVAELGEGMPAAELGEMAGLALTSAKAQIKDPLEDFEDPGFEDRPSVPLIACGQPTPTGNPPPDFARCCARWWP